MFKACRSLARNSNTHTLSLSYSVLSSGNGPFASYKQTPCLLCTRQRHENSGTDQSYKIIKPSKEKIFISNLPNGIRRPHIMKLAEEYGTVLSCSKAVNRCIFIQYSDETEAQLAVEGLDGSKIKDRVISAQFSTSANFRNPSERLKSKIAQAEKLTQETEQDEHIEKADLIVEKDNPNISVFDKLIKSIVLDPSYFYGTKRLSMWEFFMTQEELQSNTNRSNIEDLMFMAQRFENVSVKCLSDCITELEESGFSDIYHALFVLRCTGNLLKNLNPMERQAYTQRVWKTIEKNYELSIIAFNTLLVVYVENNYRYNGFDLLSKMHDLGLTPNQVTYEQVIQSYSNIGDMNAISDLIDLMIREGFAITKDIFHRLMEGNFRDGNKGAALQILDVMREQGFKPSFHTLNLLMTLYAEEGSMQGINWVLSEMENSGLPIKSHVLCDCYYHLIRKGHDDQADQVLDLWRQVIHWKDIVSTVKSLISTGFVKQAQKLFFIFYNDDHGDEYELKARFVLPPLVLNANFEEIKSFICALDDHGEKRAISETTRLAMVHKKIELSYQLLELLKQRGYPVRDNMFYPIFTIQHNSKNVYGILFAMEKHRELCDSFDIAQHQSLLYHYLFPVIDSLGKDFKECAQLLQEIGYKIEDINFPYFLYQVSHKRNYIPALDFGRQNKMNVNLLHLSGIAFLPHLAQDWQYYLEVLKICRDQTTDKNTVYGRVLIEMLKRTRERKTRNQIIRSFIEFDLKVCAKHYFGAPELKQNFPWSHVYQEKEKTKSQIVNDNAVKAV